MGKITGWRTSPRPEAFARDPNLVLRFYDMRRAAIQEKLPNAAHFALAELDAKWPGKVLIVTERR